MKKYIHKVSYYETDKMGITHHSNYIRWMEEARIDFFNQLGFPYKKVEEQGVISPIINVECNYKSTTTFDDVVEISVNVEKFTGVQLILKYNMMNLENKKIVAIGKTKQCFLDENSKPIILKKRFLELDSKLKSLMEV